MAECTVATIRTDAACINCFTEKQKLAAIQYYLCEALQAADRSKNCDIVAQVGTSACGPCLDREHALSALVWIAFNMASVTDAEVAWLPADELMDAIKCYECVDQSRIEYMILALLCQLSEYGLATLPE